jgi:prepilin-type N-terminal cleavage/methylation domain-containing protein
MRSLRRTGARGFTVIELLIATMIFSVILLVITTGILQFSRQYYKGVISSNTQNTARAIMDEITRAIQLNSGGAKTLSGGAGYCIGSSRRYSYSRNYQVTSTSPNSSLHQGYHGLIVDNISGCTGGTSAVNARNQSSLTAAPFGASSFAHDLLAEHMRLVDLSISQIGSTEAYNVRVEVAYGDDDLLCNETALAGSCAASATLQGRDLTGVTDLKCKQSAGSQFCAVSELSTTVQARIQ